LVVVAVVVLDGAARRHPCVAAVAVAEVVQPLWEY
jgi:hypothetical protein